MRIKKRYISKVQKIKDKQFSITLPYFIAMEWLDVKKGDRLEFAPYKGKICISKVEAEQ